MKKILALLLSVALVFAMASCGGETLPPEEQENTENAEAETTENTDSGISELTFIGVNSDPAKNDETKFIDLVAESSAGTLLIKSMTDSREYTDKEKIEMVLSGECDIAVGLSDSFSETVKDLYLFDIFGFFESRDQVKAFLGGENAALFKSGFEDAGLVFLGIWDNGFNQIILSETPLSKPEDLEGLKMGTAMSEEAMGLWKKLGCEPLYSEGGNILYDLEEWTVDAYEGSLESMMTSQAYTACSYFAGTSHSYTPYVCIMNLKKFNSLTDLQKSAVLSAMEDTQYSSFSESEAYEGYALKELEKAGIKIKEFSEKDTAAFKKAFADVKSESAVKKLMAHPELIEGIREERARSEESQVDDAQ